MVKIKIEFVGEGVNRVRGRQSTIVDSVEYDVCSNLPLESHIQNIIQALKTVGYPANEDFRNYCLESMQGRIFESESPLQDQLNESASRVVLVKVKPRIRAERVLENLRNPETNLKECVFLLRDQLQDANFASEFIDLGGTPLLLTIISNSTGATQSYSLTALRLTLSFVNGMRMLLNTPGLLKTLFKLVESPVVAVSRQALELLFVTCSYNNVGAEKIHAVGNSLSSFALLINR